MTRLRLLRLVPLGAVTLLSIAPALAQDEGFGPPPRVVAATRMDLSIPLRDMPLLRADPADALREIPIKRRRADRRPLLDLLRDPVLQDQPVAAGAGGTVITNFDGVTNVNGVLPPDTDGDVGPNHYVQWINLSAQIFNRSGVSLLGPFNGNQFFTGFGGPCETTNNGDPIVLYDHLADRWVVSQFVASPPFSICVAVSQTPDPTGAYFRYQFVFPNFPDYPKMGVWPDGYYVTTRSFSGNTFLGQEAIAMDRVRMLAGLPASMILFNIPDAASIDGFLPMDLDGPAPPAGAPGLFAGLPFWGPTPNQLRLYGMTVNWATPAASTFAPLGTFPVAAFSAPNDVAQPGTAVGLDVLHFFLMYRLQYRNFGTHQTLLANHSVNAGGGRSGIRWYELRNTGPSWGIHQQGTYAPADGHSRWMGSMAMNATGDIALGYSISSATLFPSIRFTGQSAASSGTGLMDVPETVIHAGGGSQTHSSGRWGDYSYLTVDPTNDGSFWYTTEYLAATGSAPWRTRIARFIIEAVPAAVASITPAAVGVGLAAGASTTRTLTVANTAPAGSQSLTFSASIFNPSPAAPSPPGSAAAGPAPAASVAPIALAGAAPAAPKGDDSAAGTGSAALLGSGGPDGFGYTWSDSNVPGGPTFSWLNVSTIGTPGPTGDDATLIVALPFAFPFYGANKTSVTVGTNGVLSFGAFSGTWWTNTALPNAALPNDLVAPFWDDLNVTATGQTDTYHDVANGRFIVQWTAVQRFGDAASNLTFQAVLYPSGVIEYYYNSMTGTLNSAAIGIENAAGTIGLQVVNDAAYVANNLAVRISPPPTWITLSPGSGVVPPGGSTPVTVTFNATGLATGLYTADIVVTTNAPGALTTTIPATLQVGGVTLTGGAGWRMMGTPVSGMTVDNLAAQNLVQGVPGYYPTAATNLYTAYDGAAWTPSTGTGQVLPPGRGMIWYLYNLNIVPGGPSNSVALPMGILPPASGTEPAAGVSVTLHSAGNDWNLVGNPFLTSLDVSTMSAWATGGALASAVGQVWDPDVSTYVLTTTMANRVASWQGLMVQNNTASGLTIPRAARSTGGVFQGFASETDRLVAFELESTDGTTGVPLFDRAIVMYFHPEGTAEWDLWDAEKLTPLSPAFAVLAFEGIRDGEPVLKAQESRPPAPEDPFDVTLDFQAIGTGMTFTLRWPELTNIPDTWGLALRDLVTGQTVDLRAVTEYTFTATPGARREGNPDDAPVIESLSGGSARFVLHVTPGVATGTAPGALPTVFALGAPAPNPATGASLFRYDVPVASDVSLEVFDLLGRRVSTLVDTRVEAGRHVARLDAGALASGVYVVRMRAGDFVAAQRVTVVR